MESVIRSAFGANTDAAQSAKEKETAAQLVAEIDAVCTQLASVNDKYNLTSDNDLIDALIYQELALRARYSYLLKLARERHIRYPGTYLSE